MTVADQSSAPDHKSQVSNSSVPYVGALVGGRYRVTCRLAEGTFGHTYLAKDTHLPNAPECVIKQLKLQTSVKAMEMARRLFNKEAEILYKLGTHPQIPRLLAHFEQDDEFFLAQEFIDGFPIADELTPDRPWADIHVVRLLREILEVLTFVHGRQVIHRDIKPGNLIRRKHDGKIVLIDFGAVKEVTNRFLSARPGETDYTIAIGTFGYIPKEQLGGRPRFSSDVFAVGMIGIQALTGVHPNELVEDERTAELRWRDRLAAPINPEFADIIDCMVRYDFRDRYPNAETALQAIQSLPTSFLEAVPAPPWRVSSATYSHLPATDAFGSHLMTPEASHPVAPPSQPSAPSASHGSDSPTRLGPSLKVSGDSSGDPLGHGSGHSSGHSSGRSSGESFGHSSRHSSESVPAWPIEFDAPPTQPSRSSTSHLASPTQVTSDRPPIPQSLSPTPHQSKARSRNAPTQMTDVVAPSFSRSHSQAGSFAQHRQGRSEHGGVGQFSGSSTGRSPNPLPPLPLSFKGRKEDILLVVGWAQHWLSRSWHIAALMSGMSLTLMLVRGMMASLGEQPVTRLNAVEPDYLRGAEHLIQTLPSVDETLSPNIEALKLLQEAHHLREAGHYQDAVNLYQQALGMNPRLIDAIWGQCAALNAQGQFEIASSVCYEALAVDPYHAKALWSSAEANEKMGLYEKAMEERNRALALDPNLPASLHSDFEPMPQEEKSEEGTL